MPDIVTTILATAPNLVIAIWCIRQYQQTIEKLLANQQSLIEQLMSLHPPQDAAPQKVVVEDRS